MADSQLYTNESAIKKGTVVKASLASSKLRLCGTAITLTRFTTKDQLVATEATYSGYPAGGYALAAWTGPYADPNGGAILTSPLVNPSITEPEDPPTVGNNITGWWVEDSTGAVRLVGSYDPPRPIQTVLDSFPVVIQIVEARNPVPTGGQTG